MKVEYDDVMRQFRIYRSEFDSHYATTPHAGDFRSVEVLDDERFEVVGRFGEVAIYNADGRIVETR